MLIIIIVSGDESMPDNVVALMQVQLATLEAPAYQDNRAFLVALVKLVPLVLLVKLEELDRLESLE